MRNLTSEEQKTILKIAEATAKQRHRLMAVPPKDNNARFFQAQAEFHSMEVLLHHGTGREIPEETVEFLQTYRKGDETEYKQEINEFIHAVEKATGRDLNL
ncbi:hypothetical protein [Marinobacter sp.]|uniref:hypothetical protein n=1 Tax=Marinobacter sp. TaxID=50741 RepID=UPI00356686D0